MLRQLQALGSPTVPGAEEWRSLANRDYQAAREAYLQGDYANAELLFRSASSRAPDFPETYYALAVLMSRTDRYAEAEHFRAEVNRRLPDTVNAALAAAVDRHGEAEATAAATDATEAGGQQVSGQGAAEAAASALPSARLQDLIEHAATAHAVPAAASAVLRRSFEHLRRIARSCEETRPLVAALAASTSAQDQHNARVHTSHLAETETRLRALVAAPLDSEGWWHLGLHCLNHRRECFCAALAFEMSTELSRTPLQRFSYYLLYHCYRQLGNWRQHELRERMLVELLRASLDGPAATGTQPKPLRTALLTFEAPYVLLTSSLVDCHPQLLLRSYTRRALESAAEAEALPDAELLKPPPPADFLVDGRLTVAVISSTPAGHVTYNLVGSMPRFLADRRLRVLWYSGSPDVVPSSGSDVGIKVETSDVRTFHSNQPAAVVAAMRRERVGVAIDLDGWIGDQPPRQLLSLGAAPVQAQWLGWAGSTGDPALHYILADGWLCPPAARGFYSETPLLLPHSYQLNDHAHLYRQIAYETPQAEAASGSSPRLTLANFNQLLKLTPEAYTVWANALRATPRAQLLLLTGVTNARLPYAHAVSNLQAELQLRGVAANRLVRGDALEKTQHLRRAAGHAIAVDTLAYNSHTTGADALWAGLPLLTLPGDYLSSRVGASLGASAGVPHSRVHSLKGYEDYLRELITPPAEPSLRAILLDGEAKPPPPPRLESFNTFTLPVHLAVDEHVKRVPATPPLRR